MWLPSSVLLRSGRSAFWTRHFKACRKHRCSSSSICSARQRPHNLLPEGGRMPTGPSSTLTSASGLPFWGSQPQTRAQPAHPTEPGGIQRNPGGLRSWGRLAPGHRAYTARTPGNKSQGCNTPFSTTLVPREGARLSPSPVPPPPRSCTLQCPAVCGVLLQASSAVGFWRRHVPTLVRHLPTPLFLSHQRQVPHVFQRHGLLCRRLVLPDTRGIRHHG